MNEQRNNGRGIFYGVIGVATLVVAIIGATFAYFTATASNNVMTGNMATVSLSLAVEKVTHVDEAGGMIPMSNGMVEAALTKNAKAPGKGVCVDDNGNAVCQIYKVTLTNTSSAAQFVDGYVALRGGSGVPSDLPSGTEYVDGALVDAGLSGTTYGTTMRWAQVFIDADGDYSTAGTQTLGTGSGEEMELDAIGAANDAKNSANIRTAYALTAEDADLQKQTALATVDATKGVLKPLEISSTKYAVIGHNYIRISNHTWKTDGTPESYKRADDITSALVFNHSIAAADAASNNDVGEYYFVVWLSETGTNQTAGATVGDITNPNALKFFTGNVTFVSAQGSEVSATFNGYSRVTATS